MKMKVMVIGSGWKMNNTMRESVNLVRQLKERLRGFTAFPVFVLPPFTALDAVGRELRGSNLQFGAQNMHSETSGAFTGEIAAPMLVELGCKYVELNHPERRVFFNESNQAVNLKLRTAFRFGLQPVLCIGEEKQDYEQNSAFFLKQQLAELLQAIDGADVTKILFAYEPHWAIGQSEAAGADYIERMHRVIRRLIQEPYGVEIASKAVIMYGGSVNPDNYRVIAVQENVNGLFIGRCGLDAEIFSDIILSVADLLGNC
jgi:triosephosphate isomerase